MGLAEDLLQQAWYLAKKERKTPRQASLRRAVSTAYYALFHFLVDEAVGKWDIARQRSVLARPFEHGKMNKSLRPMRQDVLQGWRSQGLASAQTRCAGLHGIAGTAPVGRLR
jgi:hypothetical protein